MLQIIMWVYCKIPEDIGVRIRKAEGDRIAQFTGFGFQTDEDWLCTPGLKRVFFLPATTWTRISEGKATWALAT